MLIIYVVFNCATIFFFSSRRQHTISKRDWSSDVCSSDLEVIYEHEGSSEQVFKESTAYLMSDMLQESFQSGSAYHIEDFYNRYDDQFDWAAKTGTSNSFIDSWFMGYNPKVTLGLWMGYDRNIPQVANQDAEQYMHI